MKIGIIGSGAIGGILGKLWAKTGHEVLFSSRHPEKLTSLVTQAGASARAGTVAEAAQFGDLIVLAVNYHTLDEALREVDGKLNGKTVIDATNPLEWTEERGLERKIPQDVTAARVMAQHLPTACIVKAFTTVYAPKLESEAYREGEPLAIAMAGDNKAAKETVAQLIKDAGFLPVDIGTLDESAPLDPGGVLWNSAITEAELRQRLNATKRSS
jgi:hypothetical protein